MKQTPSYTRVIGELITEDRLQPLDAGTENKEAYDQLKRLSVENAFHPNQVRDRSMAQACLAGLWLLHNYLDESHQISQAIHTSTGSYWHGIMHRREPDYGNSGYWFRRVGDHPIFDALCGEARALAENESNLDASAKFLTSQKHWDPFAFIDLCESAVRGREDCSMLCRKIQQAEWDLLFDYCFRAAVGKGVD